MDLILLVFKEELHWLELCLKVRAITERLLSAHATGAPIVVPEVDRLFDLKAKWRLTM
jgi:hypothetical protein